MLSSLFAAFTCIVTFFPKVPTPTLGYIHLGDGFVLLSGIVLGPIYGALAAGIGSMFADLFSGYASWAPATLIIKALVACTMGFIHQTAMKHAKERKLNYVVLVIGGLLSECIMIIGYFAYEIVLLVLTSGSSTTFRAATIAAMGGLPFNAMQALFGVIVACLIVPLLARINGLNREIFKDHLRDKA